MISCPIFPLDMLLPCFLPPHKDFTSSFHHYVILVILDVILMINPTTVSGFFQKYAQAYLLQTTVPISLRMKHEYL